MYAPYTRIGRPSPAAFHHLARILLVKNAVSDLIRCFKDDRHYYEDANITIGRTGVVLTFVTGAV